MRRAHAFGFVVGLVAILLFYMLVIFLENNPEICNLSYYIFRPFARIAVTYIQ